MKTNKTSIKTQQQNKLKGTAKKTKTNSLWIVLNYAMWNSLIFYPWYLIRFRDSVPGFRILVMPPEIPCITLRRMVVIRSPHPLHWQPRTHSCSSHSDLFLGLPVCGCVFIWLEISWQHQSLYLRALQSLSWYLLLVSNIELSELFSPCTVEERIVHGIPE